MAGFEVFKTLFWLFRDMMSCRVVSCRVVSCRGLQKAIQGGWHISVTFSQLKLKALGHFKTPVHLPLSQTNSGTTKNTLLFRENVLLPFTELKTKVCSFDHCVFYIDLQ